MQHKIRILHVEDVSNDAILAEIELAKVIDNFELRVVETEETFVSELKEFKPEVVISDYRLPHFNGMQALKIVLEKSPEIPVIILTGSMNEDIAVECMRAGAHDYVIKEHMKRLGPAVLNALERQKNNISKIKAEEERRQNEASYRYMFGNNPQAMWIYDLETLAFLEVNDAAVLQYGYSRDEFLKMTLKDIGPQEDIPRLMTDVEKSSEIVMQSGEWRCLTKNGQLRNVEIISHAVEFHGRKARHVMVRDITERKRAEEALRQSEMKYRSIFENVSDVFFQLNTRLRILELTPSVYGLLGYTREELIGKKINALEKDVDKIRPATRQLLEKGYLNNYEMSIKDKSGEWKYLSLNARLVCATNGTPLYVDGAFRDMTARKLIEDNLDESEERFRTLFEQNRSVMLLVDPISVQIIDANKAAEEFYGWSHEELLNKSLKEIRVSDESEPPQSLIQSSLEQEKFETVHRIANGSLRNVEVYISKFNIRGKPILHSIIFDITEKKKAERMSLLLGRGIEQSPVTIVITDKNGDIEYVNPKFTEVTGYTRAEALGKNPRILQSKYHDREYYEELWKTILSGQNWVGELRNKKKNGDIYWENALISPITDEKGNIINFVAIKEDITEKKKILEELINAKNKAEESDNLKTAFLNNISHEIRTPMNAIVGFAKFINDPGITDDRRKQFSEIIEQSSRQLMSIITDIIQIATIESGQEKLNLTEFEVNDILRMLKEQFSINSRSDEFELIISPIPEDRNTFLFSDQVKLIQVLTNLINNAIKFTSKGYVKFGYELKKDYIQFVVEDTGIGIASEYHDVIFDRFRQVDHALSRRYGGSGLGLSIAKAYVELMGGKIWLESEPGKGTIFYFTLPRRDMNPGNDNSEPVVEEPYRFSRRIRVLVAEDIDTNYLLLQHILPHFNADLIRAVNGEEAVGLCKSEAPDIVLMDIKMPKMDGYEATKRIKNYCPTMPVIALTAYFSVIDRQKAFECGCDDFISKPIEASMLFAKMRRLIKDINTRTKVTP